MVGAVIDIWSLVLTLRFNRRGHGASGIPLVPLIFYWLPAVTQTPLVTHSAALESLIMTMLHILIRYFVPWMDRKILAQTNRQ